MNKFQKLYKDDEMNQTDALDTSTPVNKINKFKLYAAHWKNCRIREDEYLSFWQKYRRTFTGVVCAAGIILICVSCVAGLFGNRMDQNNKSPVAVSENNEVKESNSNKRQDDKIKNTNKKSDDVKDLSSRDSSKKTKNKTKRVLKKGDIVYFSGKFQYKSSQSNKDKALCPKGKVEITKISKNGRHKYHIKGIRTSEYTYGWVDEKYIKKIG